MIIRATADIHDKEKEDVKSKKDSFLHFYVPFVFNSSKKKTFLKKNIIKRVIMIIRIIIIIWK